MRKSDMLKNDNEALSYSGGGLFSTGLPWIHPARTEETYEIIYMVKGVAYMEENGVSFSLCPGDLIILMPNVLHRGVRVSGEAVSFYWHHFTLSKGLGIPPLHIFKGFSGVHLFPEILHLEHAVGKAAAEPALLHLLTLLRSEYHGNSANSRLANQVYEFIRTNADASLTASRAALHFGYNVEYLSRLMKKHCSSSLKSLIDKFIIINANKLLDNSSFSIKEIAAILKFTDINNFTKFYKYHTKTTPTKYRKRVQITHMNSR